MEFGIRVCLVVNGKVKRIGTDQFSRIGDQLHPEYAGEKIPYAVLMFEREGVRLGDLRYCEGGYVGFDKSGKLDESSQVNHVRLLQAAENDPKSFAARKAQQIRGEIAWHPTGDQLNRMITLVKKSR